MHHLMLVTLSLPDSDNSADARGSAYDQLSDDDSFCGEGGRFGSPARGLVRHRRPLERNATRSAAWPALRGCL